MGRVCVCRWQEKCGRLPSQKSIPGHWSHISPAALSWIDCELLTGNLNMALISVWTHIIFVWHVCRFYWKFTFLGHSGNFFVLFICAEFSTGSNGHGQITTRQQFRRTITNSNTGFFVCLLLHCWQQPNSQERSTALRCFSLLLCQRWPRHFQVTFNARAELMLQKDFLSIAKQHLKC